MLQGIISSDTHVIEPPDLWTTRMPVALRDKAPTVAEVDGRHWWLVDGQRMLSFAGGSQVGDRFTRPRELETASRFEQVRPGGYDPAEHLRDSLADGVVGSVLYPTAGNVLYTRVRDAALFSAMCRAYNDWLIDFCSETPERLKGAAMLNTDDPGGAVEELERVRTHGIGAALIPAGQPRSHSYDDPSFEPLWSAAEDFGVPLGMHLGATRVGAGGTEHEDMKAIKPSWFTVVDYWVKESIADMIFGGVLDRHPRLMVGTVEHELGWIPHFVDRLDYTYTQRLGNARFLRFADGALPSDLFRRQVFCSFQEDALGIQEREAIGMDGLVFGSDYPHPESTFPRTRSIMGERLKDVAEPERDKILFSNAVRIYGFDPSRLPTAAL